MPSGRQASGRAAAMSGSDLFGLIVSVLICAYLLYALLRGEKF
jgi:K+-transporting ATPase KdpF subunit